MPQKLQFSKPDIRVLTLLQKNLSPSNHELANEARVSQSTLWRRVIELENTASIRKRVALLNPDIVGVSVCVFLSINLVNHGSKVRAEFEAFVEQSAQIMECFSVMGGFDYMMIVRAKSVLDFEAFLMDRVLGHKSVASASSQISLRQHKYSTELPL